MKSGCAAGSVSSGYSHTVLDLRDAIRTAGPPALSSIWYHPPDHCTCLGVQDYPRIVGPSWHQRLLDGHSECDNDGLPFSLGFDDCIIRNPAHSFPRFAGNGCSALRRDTLLSPAAGSRPSATPAETQERRQYNEESFVSPYHLLSFRGTEGCHFIGRPNEASSSSDSAGFNSSGPVLLSSYAVERIRSAKPNRWIQVTQDALTNVPCSITRLPRSPRGRSRRSSGAQTGKPAVRSA